MHAFQQLLPLGYDCVGTVKRTARKPASALAGEQPLVLTMTPGLLEKSRQAIGIKWVEVEGGVSVNPAVHGDVRRNHWSIANHRLDTGQVKALCSAWADNGLRRAVEQPKLLDRNAPKMEQATAAPLRDSRRHFSKTPAGVGDEY